MPFDEGTLKIAAGDTLFVYTDGLTDRRDSAGEFYALERIMALIEKARDTDLATLYDAIYEDVSSFPATRDMRDDIAFVVTRFH
jgi:sigma-B regulation protein RsbU (phosphoserine phosphatase)